MGLRIWARSGGSPAAPKARGSARRLLRGDPAPGLRRGRQGASPLEPLFKVGPGRSPGRGARGAESPSHSLGTSEPAATNNIQFYIVISTEARARTPARGAREEKQRVKNGAVAIDIVAGPEALTRSGAPAPGYLRHSHMCFEGKKVGGPCDRSTRGNPAGGEMCCKRPEPSTEGRTWATSDWID